jgi:hypothetical protein
MQGSEGKAFLDFPSIFRYLIAIDKHDEDNETSAAAKVAYAAKILFLLRRSSRSRFKRRRSSERIAAYSFFKLHSARCIANLYSG